VTAIIPDPVSPDLRKTLRALKLGQMLDTLPDRLTLARQQKMAHADFLELVLADEVTRREAKSAGLRARAAGLDPAMRPTPGPERRRPLRPAAVERAHLAVPRRIPWNPHLGVCGAGKTQLASARTHHYPPAPHRAHRQRRKLVKRLRASVTAVGFRTARPSRACTGCPNTYA